MPVISTPDSHTHELHGARFTAMVSPSRGTVETCIWQVEIPVAAPSTPHEMTREEVLVILAGQAEVRLGDDRFHAGVGDVVVVPPDTLFDLTNEGDEPLRALVYLPVGGQARIDGATFTPPWAQ
jgi:mannose-6-phosphate isomerase-like protein (cupin superfamily)